MLPTKPDHQLAVSPFDIILKFIQCWVWMYDISVPLLHFGHLTISDLYVSCKIFGQILCLLKKQSPCDLTDFSKVALHMDCSQIQMIKLVA